MSVHSFFLSGFFALVLAGLAPVALAQTGNIDSLHHTGTVVLGGQETPYHLSRSHIADDARLLEQIKKLTQGYLFTAQDIADKPDRHGRLPARLIRSDGMDLEKEIIRQGLGIVMTYQDDEQTALLLQAEQNARAQNAGGWEMDIYKIDTPESVKPYALRLVSGSIVSAAKVNGTIYLNFGEDYKTDFTIMIPRPVASLYKKQDIDPLTWQNKTVRVRGWAGKWNGAFIKLSSPAQIEILE